MLGAGNQVSVAAIDALRKLLLDDHVVILNTNPVNEYAGPLLAAALAPLVQAPFLAFANGPAAVGAALGEHPGVCSLYLNCSAVTFNAIVWHGKP